MVAVASSIHQKPDWIISRGQDLVWFQGAVFAGLALLALFLILPGFNSSNYAPGHAAVLILFALWLRRQRMLLPTQFAPKHLLLVISSAFGRRQV